MLWNGRGARGGFLSINSTVAITLSTKPNAHVQITILKNAKEEKNYSLGIKEMRINKKERACNAVRISGPQLGIEIESLV